MDVLLLDFDGAITRRDTTRVWVFALLRARPWRVFRVLAPLLRLAVGGDEEEIQRAKDRAVGALLRGLSEEQVRPSLLRYRMDVLPLIRPELAALMRERAGAGQQVLVVTALAEHAVREALRDFPVTVLGTRFEAREGRFSGAVEDEGCYGAAKVPRIRAWADAQPPAALRGSLVGCAERSADAGTCQEAGVGVPRGAGGTHSGAGPAGGDCSGGVGMIVVGVRSIATRGRQ